MMFSSHRLYAARAQGAELRFTQLKERHAELITSHADLMKKVQYSIVVVTFALLCKKMEIHFFAFLPRVR